MAPPNTARRSATVLLDKRILIVEDDAVVALTLEIGVEDAGGRVVGPAFDLATAVRLAEQPLDAAVLDINLRGEKVFPAARKLRDRRVPILFASANLDEIDSLDGEFADCPRLDKPLSVVPLIERLVRMVGAVNR
jgi:DNA-binding response OmpR family regulator